MRKKTLARLLLAFILAPIVLLTAQGTAWAYTSFWTTWTNCAVSGDGDFQTRMHLRANGVGYQPDVVEVRPVSGQTPPSYSGFQVIWKNLGGTTLQSIHYGFSPASAGTDYNNFPISYSAYTSQPTYKASVIIEKTYNGTNLCTSAHP